MARLNNTPETNIAVSLGIDPGATELYGQEDSDLVLMAKYQLDRH